MKNKIIIGNWKLNGNKDLIKKIIKHVKNIKLYNNIAIIMPPLIYMHYMIKKANNIKNLHVGSQNVDFNIEGSFTGEISSYMLKDIGINYVMIGHFERRKFHKENNDIILKKFISIKKYNMIPILCIGENINIYEKKKSLEYCINQIKIIIKKLGIESLKNTMIAYEPIWAIGSNILPNVNHIKYIIEGIKEYLIKKNKEILNNINFLYGGSISIKNIELISNEKHINGILIGKSSLNPIDFKNIIELYIK